MAGSHRRFDDTHTAIAELLAVRALGGLSATDQDDLDALRAGHRTDCPECAALEAEFAETAADLALAAPTRAPADAAWDRLLAATDSDRVDDRKVTWYAGPRRPMIRRLLAAAAALVLLVAGGAIGYGLFHSTGSGRQQAIAKFVNHPDTRLVRFDTTGATSLSVLYRPGHADAWLVGAGLPKPATDHVYELWYQPNGQQIMRPAGTFGGGTIGLHTTIGGHPQAFAVSVEPHGGSQQPTTKPIYLATVKS